MSYPAAFDSLCIRRYDDIDTIDIRLDSLADKKTDYLSYKIEDKPDLIITNPPYNKAMSIIKKALEDVKEKGWVIMLLRLSFLESQKRKLFWDEYMPEYIFVHSKRMSFTGRGTDSTAYAHFCWHKGNYTEFSNIKVI